MPYHDALRIDARAPRKGYDEYRVDVVQTERGVYGFNVARAIECRDFVALYGGADESVTHGGEVFRGEGQRGVSLNGRRKECEKEEHGAYRGGCCRIRPDVHSWSTRAMLHHGGHMIETSHDICTENGLWGQPLRP